MKRLSGPRFWEHHELFGVAFKSQSCWDGYFQVTLNNKGWCVSQLHYHYLYSVVVCTHQESEIPKKTFPKNTQHTKKNLPNVISSSCLFFSTSPMFSPQSKRNAGSGHIHSISEQSNLLGPANKFHILHVRNLHQKMAKTVKSFGSNVCPRLTS